MGTDHVDRLARSSLGGALVGAVLALALGAPTWAAGIGMGAAWGVANLYVLRFLVIRWIRPREEKRREPRLLELAIGLAVKFPVLYGAGYLLLRSDWFRVEALVIGFIIPFAAAFIDALGRVIRESRAARDPAAPGTGVARTGTNVESGC